MAASVIIEEVPANPPKNPYARQPIKTNDANKKKDQYNWERNRGVLCSFLYRGPTE